MSDLLSLIGGGTFEATLKPPDALQKDSNAANNYGKDLPSPDADGTTLQFPTNSTSTLNKMTVNNVADWTVTLANVNANCDTWSGAFWLDTTDSAIWVWPFDTTTSPDTYYLASVALATGVVTNVGTCQPGDGYFSAAFQNYYVERAAMGSGDLTIRDGEYKIIIDTSDGSISTAAAQVTQNGRTMPTDLGYETADGLIYISGSYPVSNTIEIHRGGATRLCSIPDGSPYGVTAPYFVLWNGYVALANTSTNAVYNGRYFSRVKFDAWLVKIADYYGLPD